LEITQGLPLAEVWELEILSTRRVLAPAPEVQGRELATQNQWLVRGWFALVSIPGIAMMWESFEDWGNKKREAVDR
jgi:hypothetical protein